MKHRLAIMPHNPVQEWSYLRGGLTTIDRDYGIFSRIQHSIGIHVVHHLFPQVGCRTIEGGSALLVLADYYMR